MSANETPRGGGALDESAGRRVPSQNTVDRFLNGEIPAHDLPWPLPLIYSQGFRDGCARRQPAIERAEADADRFYYELYNGDEAKARHRELLKSHDVMQARRSMAEVAR